jgi:hypothetical protein
LAVIRNHQEMNAIRITIPLKELFNIHVEEVGNEFVAAWLDAQGNERVRGFGTHPIAALTRPQQQFTVNRDGERSFPIQFI